MHRPVQPAIVRARLQKQLLQARFIQAQRFDVDGCDLGFHRPLLRTHAIAADATKSTIGIVGLPPMTNRCVKMAPTIVAARASAPKRASDGTNSSTAPSTSIEPVT